LQYAPHQGLHRFVCDLNRLYRSERALYQRDFSNDGFQWVDLHDWESSIVSYLRRGEDPADCLLVACNFTPVVRHGYRVGVPCGGYWAEVLNSDAAVYGGSNVGNAGGAEAAPLPAHGYHHSLTITLPPLGVVVFRAPR
ncbi:MAG: alpha amylase C-terminal domain-containing protein, partial [Sulfurimicrobium sp.]